MKVGFTASAFDLFHAGHVAMLEDAKRNCDYLIAGIQIDPSVDRAEKNQPVQTLIERQIQVRGCKYVDEIIVYATEEDLITILKTIPIDVRILGEEYRDKDYSGKGLTPETYYNKRRHDFSSTDLRKRIKEK